MSNTHTHTYTHTYIHTHIHIHTHTHTHIHTEEWNGVQKLLYQKPWRCNGVWFYKNKRTYFQEISIHSTQSLINAWFSPQIKPILFFLYRKIMSKYELGCQAVVHFEIKTLSYRKWAYRCLLSLVFSSSPWWCMTWSFALC